MSNLQSEAHESKRSPQCTEAGSAGKALAAQARGPEFDPQKSVVASYNPERQKQADSKLQAAENLPKTKANTDGSLQRPLRLTYGLHMHIHHVCESACAKIPKD